MATNFFFQANKILKQHDSSSFATKSERFKTIRLVDKQLVELGFKGLELKGLKLKHIDALLGKWQAEKLSAGTIKNRMAHVRWLAEKIGKKGIVPQSNAGLGIEQRVYVTNENRGKELSQEQLNSIPDQHVKMSLKLQQAFGLRREEAMKIQPAKADRGDRLILDASWCKGGRDRTIPILTEQQRALLQEAKLLAAGRSLIPKERTYKEQVKRYENTCIKIGLDRAHGLRHHYAQQRYLALTGFEAPAVSGERVKSLSETDKAADKAARAVITKELGHGRLQVTAVYLGS
ncbi:phage integrase N-terminal domain-containing protein [Shewanella colwelliana]|uniref:phage integrase N-terminal domain-containing protein n=1 Tax=Shewanella colwelliana TaxID=23 RepID=UPI0022AF0EF8|nr:phage integrase N-terminal domain-containing protein [Shewanella colwelliana]MCZ4339880.1 integrase domain-containing protein [Shewanella colwelliana]